MKIAVQEKMETVTDFGSFTTGDGRYLNPRDTAGWKQEWIQSFNQWSETAYISYQAFLDDFIGEEDSHDRRECAAAFELTGTKQLNALEKSLSNVLKLNALGRTPENAYQRAVKHLHQQYDRIADGSYANFNAFKWSYLDPVWNYFYVIQGQSAKDTVYLAFQG